jgi:hypothetical protein
MVYYIPTCAANRVPTDAKGQPCTAVRRSAGTFSGIAAACLSVHSDSVSCHSRCAERKTNRRPIGIRGKHGRPLRSAATRGRSATERSDGGGRMKRRDGFERQPANARGERRGQGRARSSMTHPPLSPATMRRGPSRTSRTGARFASACGRRRRPPRRSASLTQARQRELTLQCDGPGSLEWTRSTRPLDLLVAAGLYFSSAEDQAQDRGAVPKTRRRRRDFDVGIEVGRC